LRRESYPKDFRITKTKEYEKVYREGKKLTGKFVILHAKPNELDHPRLGITVTKKSGKAVIRNRWKRMLREIFRKEKEKFPSFDMVFTAKKESSLPSYQDLKEDVLKLIGRLK